MYSVHYGKSWRRLWSPNIDDAGLAPPSREYRTREGTGGTATGVRDAGVRSDEGVRGGGEDIVRTTYLYC